MNKYVENSIKVVIPVALIGAVAFAAPILGKEHGKNIIFESSPEIKGFVSYAPKETPKGFSIVEGRSVENISPLKAAQSPGSWVNASNTCRFTPSIGYFPEGVTSADEEFLSKKYLYDEAEKYVSIPSETKIASLESTSGTLAAFYASYEIPNNGSLTKDMNSGKYYRTTASRIIAQPVSLAEDPNSPGNKGAKALPIIVLNYDCITKDDYKENEFKQMIKASVVDFKTEHSTEIPKKEETPKDSAVVDDPSDDIEDDYTFTPEEFVNPNEVIDRGTGRGATDDAPVVTDPSQVQATEPAWKQ